jgi:hypothetical protein
MISGTIICPSTMCRTTFHADIRPDMFIRARCVHHWRSSKRVPTPRSKLSPSTSLPDVEGGPDAWAAAETTLVNEGSSFSPHSSRCAARNSSSHSSPSSSSSGSSTSSAAGQKPENVCQLPESAGWDLYPCLWCARMTHSERSVEHREPQLSDCQSPGAFVARHVWKKCKLLAQLQSAGWVSCQVASTLTPSAFSQAQMPYKQESKALPY